MEWYKGGVVNAISKCRHEKALFIVYISGRITLLVTSTLTCSTCGRKPCDKQYCR